MKALDLRLECFFTTTTDIIMEMKKASTWQKLAKLFDLMVAIYCIMNHGHTRIMEQQTGI